MPGLMDSRGSWENDRTEGSELRVGTPATLSKACWSRSFPVSLHLGDKEAPLFWVQGAHLSHEALMTCVREEGGVGEGEGQRGLAAPAVSLSLNSQYTKVSMSQAPPVMTSNKGLGAWELLPTSSHCSHVSITLAFHS